jgi:hypothetical protein
MSVPTMTECYNCKAPMWCENEDGDIVPPGDGMPVCHSCSGEMSDPEFDTLLAEWKARRGAPT